MDPNKIAHLTESREKVLVWEFFEYATGGYFVDVGANHPKNGSQTWLLEQLGWTGLLIEPQPSQAALLRRDRPRSKVFEGAVSSPENCGQRDFHLADHDGFSSLSKNVDDLDVSYLKSFPVQVRTLDDLLSSEGATRVDFISIDVEGTELDTLRGFDLTRWKPRLILLEDKLHNLSKHEYLGAHGYKLAKRTGLNNWYVPAAYDFQLTTATERLKLFRKVFIGLPVRALRYKLRKSRLKK